MRKLLFLILITLGVSCIKPDPLPPYIILKAVDGYGNPVVGADIATGNKIAEVIGFSFDFYDEGVTDENGEYRARRSGTPTGIIIAQDGYCDFTSLPVYPYDRNAVAIEILYLRKSVVRVKLDPSTELGPGEDIHLYRYFGRTSNTDFVFTSHDDVFETDVCTVDASNKIEFRHRINSATLSSNSTTFHVPSGDTLEVFLHF